MRGPASASGGLAKGLCNVTGLEMGLSLVSEGSGKGLSLDGLVMG